MTLFELPSRLVWLTITVAVFAAANALSRSARRHAFAHPVLTATPVLIALLVASRTTYETYRTATLPLSFLFGPATVCLAIHAWKNRAVFRAHFRPLVIALAAGGLTAIISAAGTAWILGAPLPVLASLAPRATTTPVAMAIAAHIHGSASLAAVAVLSSGIFVAMIYPFVFARLGVRDARAIGFAVGVSAPGIGTASAFQNSETEGAFAAVRMVTNAIFTAIAIGVFTLLL